MDIGFDLGAGDTTALWRVDGMHYVCTLPDELGHVTDLRVERGKVVADTVSGIPFIVPMTSTNRG